LHNFLQNLLAEKGTTLQMISSSNHRAIQTYNAGAEGFVVLANQLEPYLIEAANDGT